MTELQDAKPWWESRAMWGALIAGAASLFRLRGAQIDEGALTELALSLAGLAGAVLSAFGRYKATRPIRLR